MVFEAVILPQIDKQHIKRRPWQPPAAKLHPFPRKATVPLNKIALQFLKTILKVI